MAEHKNRVQVKFRLHKDLLAELEQAARYAGHSVNAEIEQRLGRTLDADELRQVLADVLPDIVRRSLTTQR